MIPTLVRPSDLACRFASQSCVPSESAVARGLRIRARYVTLAVFVVIAVLTGRIAAADPLEDGAKTEQPNASTTNATSIAGTKRALIVCGLSGDSAHHKLFAENVGKLHTGLSQQLGFSASDVQVLFGDQPLDDDVDLIKSAGRATREELDKAAAGLREKLRPEDALWVIVLGHSHYDGKHSWLNLPGPDMQQHEFAKLFADLTVREQVFFITTPTSGFFVKPLSAKGRVVITATETDWETNETEFPHELARVLSTPPDAKEFDIDQDGTITLFDLYITVTRNLAQSYLESELLATEHPLLDDNGDGRGTELQIDYLTVEQGGRAKPNKPQIITIKPTSDGGVSKTIRLSLTPANNSGPSSNETP